MNALIYRFSVLTLETYSHVTESMQDRAALRMEGLVGSPERKAVQL